jgi:hypothetical protein
MRMLDFGVYIVLMSILDFGAYLSMLRRIPNLLFSYAWRSLSTINLVICSYMLMSILDFEVYIWLRAHEHTGFWYIYIWACSWGFRIWYSDKHARVIYEHTGFLNIYQRAHEHTWFPYIYERANEDTEFAWYIWACSWAYWILHHSARTQVIFSRTLVPWPPAEKIPWYCLVTCLPESGNYVLSYVLTITTNWHKHVQFLNKELVPIRC